MGVSTVYNVRFLRQMLNEPRQRYTNVETVFFTKWCMIITGIGMLCDFKKIEGNQHMNCP